MAETEEKHWWYRSRREILFRIIASFFEWNPPSTVRRILDAGCGTGGNLSLLRHFGDVDAFEMNELGRAAVKQKYGIDAKEGWLPEHIPFNGKYDLITSFDTMYCIEEDQVSVIALADLLEEKGVLFLTNPAYEFLKSPYDKAIHTKRRYNRKSTIRLLENAGLEVIQVGYFNTFLFPLALTVRVLGKWTKRYTNDRSIPSRPINSLCRRVFAAEKYFVSRFGFPFGLSVYGVARKR